MAKAQTGDPAVNRPGYKTTEFWLSLAVNVAILLGVIGEKLDGEWGAMLVAASAAVYGFVRTWNKRTGAKDADLRRQVLQVLGTERTFTTLRTSGPVDLRRDVSEPGPVVGVRDVQGSAGGEDGTAGDAG